MKAGKPMFAKSATEITFGGPALGHFFDPVVPDTYENQRTIEGQIIRLGLTGHQRVLDFMQSMEQVVPATPQWPDEATFRLRVRLDMEEQFEKLCMGYYTGDPEQILDGACDVEVVGIGSILAFGINYDLAIAEVDRSNMSKLGADGKPIKDEHGKVGKGPNYSKPNLVQFLHGLEKIPAPYDTKAIVLEEVSNIIKKVLEKMDGGEPVVKAIVAAYASTLYS